MDSFFNTYKSKLALILFLLGLLASITVLQQTYYHRWLGYERMPDTKKIIDERNYVAAALTFQRTGIPTAWSNLDWYKILADQKKHPNISYNGFSILANSQLPSLQNRDQFNYPIVHITELDYGNGIEHIRMVQPFIDHSPFAGMIYTLTVPKDTPSFGELNSGDFRKMALYLGVLTGILLYIYTSLLYHNAFVGFAATAIYTSVPTYILSSRYALIENVLIPLSLVLFIWLLLYKKIASHNSWLSWILTALIGVTTGLGILSKESGIYLLLFSFIMLLIYKARFWQIVLTVILAVSIGSLFHIYAYILSPELFYGIFINQAERGFFGSLNFFFGVSELHFKDFPSMGYWLWGFITLLILAIRKDNGIHQEVLIGTASYLFVFLIFGAGNFPWYYLPFVPFLVIASAYSVWHIINKPSIIEVAVFFLFAVSASYYWGYSQQHPAATVLRSYRLLILVFAILPLVVIYRQDLAKIGSKLGHRFSLPALVKDRVVLANIIWYFWIIFMLGILYKVYFWNTLAMQYITVNWGKFLELFTVRAF